MSAHFLEFNQATHDFLHNGQLSVQAFKQDRQVSQFQTEEESDTCEAGDTTNRQPLQSVALPVKTFLMHGFQ